MECRSCGTLNAAGRRYCRECGGHLGAPCTACAFFNGFGDKHCGGCGRRLKGAGPLAEEAHSSAAYAPALTDDMGFGDDEAPVAPVAAGTGALSGQEGVSQSEIDGLFDNMLDDEAGGEGGA